MSEFALTVFETIRDICSLPASYGTRIIAILLALGYTKVEIMETLHIKKAQYSRLIKRLKEAGLNDDDPGCESLQDVNSEKESLHIVNSGCNSLQYVNSEKESLHIVNSEYTGSWAELFNGGDLEIPDHLPPAPDASTSAREIYSKAYKK